MLADIGMPERERLRRRARSSRSTPDLAHIPVLLLAGAFEPVDEARARQVGCDGVLVKPFEPQLVIARVRELLERSQAATAPTPRHVPAPNGAVPAVAAGPGADEPAPPSSTTPRRSSPARRSAAGAGRLDRRRSASTRRFARRSRRAGHRSDRCRGAATDFARPIARDAARQPDGADRACGRPSPTRRALDAARRRTDGARAGRALSTRRRSPPPAGPYAGVAAARASPTPFDAAARGRAGRAEPACAAATAAEQPVVSDAARRAQVDARGCSSDWPPDRRARRRRRRRRRDVAERLVREEIAPDPNEPLIA